MIKKIVMVILGIIVLAGAAVAVHLPTRHLVYRFYNGFQIYLQLEEGFKAEAVCQDEAQIHLCVDTLLKRIGGFKFGTDVGFALAVLMNKNLSYDAFLQANSAFIRSIDPKQFWIRGIKGKAAKRVFSKEKKDLIKALTDNRKSIETAIKEKQFPNAQEEHSNLISAIDTKIAELSE